MQRHQDAVVSEDQGRLRPREPAPEHAVRGHRSVDDTGNRFGALDHLAEKLLAVIGVITKSAKVEQ